MITQNYVLLIVKPVSTYNKIEYSIIHMDEFVSTLIREEECFSIILPRIPKRFLLEQQGVLEPRMSALEIDLQQNPEGDIEELKPIKEESVIEKKEEDDENNKPTYKESDNTEKRDDNKKNHKSHKKRHHHHHHHKDRSKSRSRSRSRSKEHSRHKAKDKSKDNS